jgi:pyrroline-5-carboxylate reductase
MSKNTCTVGFIGAGKMVSAIVRSLLREGTFSPNSLSCCSANDGTSEKLAETTAINRFESVDDMLSACPTVLVLGCKPQQLGELPPSVAEQSSNCLILSIMAGITLSRLSKVFPKARNIVRSMPNTPGQIGHGATGYLFAQPPSPEDGDIIEQILSSLGAVYELSEEADLDRVTAISGSGPAYVFEFTCALEEAARAIGLSGKLAKELAQHTITGAARLIESAELHPKELRDQVTSPNGTTQAALESFSADNLRTIVRHAVEAARARSVELSRE